VPELVAGESENLEAARPEPLRQLVELVVVSGRRASEGRHVDDHARFPAVFGQLQLLPSQSLGREIVDGWSGFCRHPANQRGD